MNYAVRMIYSVEFPPKSVEWVLFFLALALPADLCDPNEAWF